MKIKQLFFSDNQIPSFKDNSLAITNLLGTDEIDFEELQSLIEQREGLVKQRLEDISPEDKQQFVADELKTNEDLKKLVGALRAEQQSLLVNFLRSKKAIKKYNK